MERVKIVAELGLNGFHGEDRSLFLNNYKRLIDVAQVFGCDYVKFQKRNPEVCVPKKKQKEEKIVPWHSQPITYLQYKKDTEFSEEDYQELSDYCFSRGIKWFASAWDIPSVKFLRDVNDYGIIKIPSAKITDLELCEEARNSCDTLIISIGMSTEEQIEKCIDACNPDVIMHCNSEYPCDVSDLNLRYIRRLKIKYPDKAIGYSGHEIGLSTTFAAVAMGAEWVERHFTFNKNHWGSDQLSSLDSYELSELVKGIRDIEVALGSDGPREILEGEKSKLKDLR